MLCKFFIENGNEVINYDHGSGQVLHDFVIKFYTDLSYVSEFVTYNNFHKELLEKRYKEFCKFDLYKKDVRFNFLKNKKKFFISTQNKKQELNKNLKVLYVSTVYLGYETRFRPIIPDMMYFDFQIRLINFLKSLNFDVTIKPHPEGKLKTPTHKFNCKKINNKFEQIKDIENYDFILTDHIASSTVKSMIFLNLPVILINYNTPHIYADTYELIKKSFFVVDTFINDQNRLMIDNNKFLSIINQIKQNVSKDKKTLRQLYF